MEMVEACLEVVSKIDVLEDPGPKMNDLYDIFAKRWVMTDLLKEVDRINLGIS
jgi:cell division FtsZ-interacting protein ZapD